MILTSQEDIQTGERTYAIKLNSDEYCLLCDCKKLSRIVAYSAGYFRLDVKMTHIDNPYEPKFAIEGDDA